MKSKIKATVLASLVMFFLLGCVGTKNTYVPNWTDANVLHRVGPKAKIRVYYWDAEKEKWFLSDDCVEVPEGFYISPPVATEPE